MNRWGNLTIAAKITIVMTLVIVVIVIIVVPCILLIGQTNIIPTITPTITPTPKDIIIFNLVEPIRFMCSCSTNGIDGRTKMGDLILNNQLIESGLDSVDDLNKYLAIFPVGSNYYNHNNSARFNGNLSGYLNWEFYVLSNAHPIKTNGNGVLEITSDQPPVYIDESMDLEGIVVRHGGILFIKRGNNPIILKVGFILVESGGLLQAGSSLINGFRLGEPLDTWPIGSRTLDIIIKTPDTGYRHAGNITSQYSYKIYNPGITIDDIPTFSSYTGKQPFESMFGPRVIACGFNGTIHLAGSISEDVDYNGTWDAKNSNDNSIYLGNKSDLLTLNAHENNYIIDKYPNTWCHLGGNSIYNKGDKKIILDESVKNKLSQWKPGYQILITFKTEKYCDVLSDPNPNIDGRFPIWMDHDDQDERSYNLEANTTTPVIKDLQDGIEIGTIESIDQINGIIILKNGLQFRHLNNKSLITNSLNSINIDTRVHVALLTRSIRISPEINKSGLGSGMNRWYYDVKDIPLNLNDGWFGSLGSVVCNYDKKTNGSENITVQCYDPIYSGASDVNNYCNTLRPVSDSKIKGHWFYGTTNVTSSNAIIGFHTMFRYGSNTCFDGIELYRAGIPANSGTIGQYPIHYHLAGFTKSFIEYRPLDSLDNDRRDGIIANCSIHSSYNRWVALHGAHEATIRNNVGFLSRGSGYFAEAGLEINNVFEHNLAAACLPMQNDEYYNPCYIPNTNIYDGSQFIYATTSSDLLFPSSFWFKSNQTSMLRNVVCNNFGLVIGVWYTATFTSNLRDIPNVILGDSIRKLPALGSIINAKSNLNQYFGHTTNNPPCWTTTALQNSLLSDKYGCIVFVIDANSTVPLRCQAENIFYNLPGATSSFPDYSFNPYLQDLPIKNFIKHNGIPSFVPINCHNGCTESQQIGQATYYENLFGGGLIASPYNETNFTYPYMPLTTNEVKIFDDEGYTKNLLTKSMNLPMSTSGMLTYNLSQPANQLFAACAWNKNAPTYLINSCLLQDGGGNGCGGLSYSSTKAASTMWLTMVGDGVNKFTNIYHAFHNLIIDGCLSITPNPTVYSGNKTFISNDSSIGYCEYADNNTIAAIRLYLGSDITTNIFPSGFFAKLPTFPYTSSKTFGKLYELQSEKTYNFQIGQTNLTEDGKFTKSNTRKYPFMCNNNQLFRDFTSSFMTNNPHFNNIVVNTQFGLFLNDNAIKIGDDICNYFQSIIPNDI